jgi:hypothetical protein
MQLAKAFRDQELDRLLEEIFTPITREHFEQAIRVHDLSARVHEHHRVGQCLKKMLNGYSGSPLQL